MQSSMSASGMENYLEQLSKMAESQQQINQGSQQCSNPGLCEDKTKAFKES